MDTENSKTNEPHQFGLDLSRRSDLRTSHKHVAFQNLHGKNIRRHFKNNKLTLNSNVKR